MLQINETYLLMMLFLGLMVRDIIKAFATEGWMYYLGKTHIKFNSEWILNTSLYISGQLIDMLGSYSMGCTRALISTCVNQEETGKIFSMITFMDNLVPMGLSQVYASIYQVRIVTKMTSYSSKVDKSENLEKFYNASFSFS